MDETDNQQPSTLPPNSSDTFNLEQRLAFLELGESDRQRLRELLHPLLTSAGSDFVRVFYQHLLAFKETARLLEAPGLIEHLKELQQSHLASMLEANWTEEYVNQRFRVGEVHAHRGVNPQMLLGAYNQYLQFGLQTLAERPSLDVRSFAALVSSLIKAVLLDIGLTLEAYFSEASHDIRQALEIAFSANAELRQFAQFTSHDLKTPLATVANLCDEALDEFGNQMPEEARGLISAARNRAFRMGSTIDELLRSSSQLHTAEPATEIWPGHLIAEIVSELRPVLDEKKIVVSVTDELPAILGDRIRIREVFFNLISNAAKFADKRPGQIRVGFESTAECCTFSVSDNGPGIPPEELQRIFTPFRRLPQHQAMPGSGLGLYFARTIVEQQGGQIWADSTQGVGSTFFVRLRCATLTK